MLILLQRKFNECKHKPVDWLIRNCALPLIWISCILTKHLFFRNALIDWFGFMINKYNALFQSSILIMPMCVCIQTFTLNANITCHIRCGITHWYFVIFIHTVAWYALANIYNHHRHSSPLLLQILPTTWLKTKITLFLSLYADMSSNWESNLFLNLVLCSLFSKWTPSADNCEV